MSDSNRVILNPEFYNASNRQDDLNLVRVEFDNSGRNTWEWQCPNDQENDDDENDEKDNGNALPPIAEPYSLSLAMDEFSDGSINVNNNESMAQKSIEEEESKEDLAAFLGV